MRILICILRDGACLNAVSRLKGIETNGNLAPLSVNAVSGEFECSFPFEGNWNVGSGRLYGTEKSLKFECSFPFEGNWNLSSLSEGLKSLYLFECSFPFEGNWNASQAPLSVNAVSRFNRVWMQFPVWRELKRHCIGITSGRFHSNPSLNAVSRLKGIETASATLASLRQSLVWMQFPVWRELKPACVRSG